MGRTPCCEQKGLKKGPWTAEEDDKLMAYVQDHGHGSWRSLPAKAGLKRCGKSCRLRWINYLRPDIKRGKFTSQEDQTIIQLHALLGNRWSVIATHLSKRTDNEVKNYWNTHLKKRLTKMGIDPITHKPQGGALDCGSHSSRETANLRHIAQWEAIRLEAEARLVGESKHTVLPTTTPAYAKPCSSIRTIGVRPKAPCLDILKAWQGVICSMFTASTLTNNNVRLLESPVTVFDNSVPVIPKRDQFNHTYNSVTLENSSMTALVDEYQPADTYDDRTALWFEEEIFKTGNVLMGDLSDVFSCDNQIDINLTGVGSDNFNESGNYVMNGSGEENWNCLLNVANVLTSGSPEN